MIMVVILAITFIIILIIIFNIKDMDMQNGKFPLIKNIYLYLVSFVALMMTVTSLYSLLDTGLRTWVFTEAENYYYEKPVMSEITVDNETGEKRQLTSEEIQTEEARIEKQNEQNRVANLQKDLARNISILVIAIPLFSYHWYLVRKKENE